MSYALVNGRQAGDDLAGPIVPKSVMTGAFRLLREQAEARDRGVALAPKLLIPGMVAQAPPPGPSQAADIAAQQQQAAMMQQRVAQQVAVLRNMANADAMRAAGFSGSRPTSFAAGLFGSSSRVSPLALVAGAAVLALVLRKKKR